MGLTRSDALALIVQTAMGTSKLLEGGMSPLELRKMVTSPGGTTAAGLRVFEEKGFQNTVMAAIEAAESRAKELGKEY
jgi:pyrroline-5-carboxylate reductase